MTNRAFTAQDDCFHFADMGDDWWATETAWFSFHKPERNLGGWFYTMARPNIGTIAGGAWVWDHTAHLPWEVLYSANYSALPIPTGQDLDDIQLPTGVSIKVLTPCQSYALGYRDGERLHADLQFDAVMPPEALTAAGSTFGSAHHFDQFGRVSGHIILHGERIDIDCLAMRDRTWGRRPENRPRQAAYITGMSDAENGFLAVTNVRPDGDAVVYGFLRRGGNTVPLAGGQRHTDRDPETGFTRRVRLEMKDQSHRTVSATGQPLSRIVINRHSFIDINSLIRWEFSDGTVAWGEEQDMWPVHRFSRLRRAQG